MEHIAQYTTYHSECIVTEDYENARIFQLGVDAAAVYVNASTRFTDGFEFGCRNWHQHSKTSCSWTDGVAGTYEH